MIITSEIKLSKSFKDRATAGVVFFLRNRVNLISNSNNSGLVSDV